MRTEPDTKTEALAEAAEVIAALPVDIAKQVDYVEVKTIDQISLRLRGSKKGPGKVIVWGSAAQSADKADVLAVLIEKDVREIDVSRAGPADHALAEVFLPGWACRHHRGTAPAYLDRTTSG